MRDEAGLGPEARAELVRLDERLRRADGCARAREGRVAQAGETSVLLVAMGRHGVGKTHC